MIPFKILGPLPLQVIIMNGPLQQYNDTQAAAKCIHKWWISCFETYRFNCFSCSTRRIVCQQPIDNSFRLSSNDGRFEEHLVLISSSGFEFDPSLLCLYASSFNTLHHMGVTLEYYLKTFMSKARTQRASSSKFTKSVKSCFVYVSRQKYLNER